ncbi:large ribosomal subunit protein uL2-like [Miscanthus floridulus]|uniref:large ribosomal subunit protein uL2-like n=1 Tax=Miscanthus floridulus TaxID=154761 RepID=UPI003457C377
MLSIDDAQGMYIGQLIYYSHRATLSIGNIPPLCGILKDAVICNASARASGDYAVVVSRNPDSNTSARASGDYAIIVSHNPDSDTSTRASGDYAITSSHNPDNGVRARNASCQGRNIANDGEVDNIRRDAWTHLAEREKER